MKNTTATTTATRPLNPLLEIRTRRQMKQERLAALSGLSRGWVGFLERNPEAMTPGSAEKLAEILHCKAKDLLPCARGQPTQ